MYPTAGCANKCPKINAHILRPLQGVTVDAPPVLRQLKQTSYRPLIPLVLFESTRHFNPPSYLIDGAVRERFRDLWLRR
nr:hypothetical protein Iba_scaffold1460942CG0010 [Ipomoea batatas]